MIMNCKRFDFDLSAKKKCLGQRSDLLMTELQLDVDEVQCWTGYGLFLKLLVDIRTH